MIHYRLRIAKLLERATWHIMKRIMNRLALEIFQLRDPIPDEIARWITFLRLSDGIEDSLVVSLVGTTRQKYDLQSRAVDLFRSTMLA